jgi:hypothetical protein
MQNNSSKITKKKLNGRGKIGQYLKGAVKQYIKQTKKEIGIRIMGQGIFEKEDSSIIFIDLITN